MIDLKTILETYPNCLSSRASFKSILMDKYPGEKRAINILTIIFECGIAQKIKSKSQLGENEFQSLLMQLENEYGIVSKYSYEGLKIWATAFDVMIQEPSKQFLETPTTKNETIIHAPIVENVIVEGTKSDYEIKIENGEITIVKFIGFDEEEIIIPNRIDGVPVKIIGKDAFKKCLGIKKVIIPEGITEIENGAFSECKSLETVILPTSLKKIGNKPKDQSNKYSWIHLERGVFDCCGIKDINLPVGLTFLGPGTFRGCSKLEQIDLPNGIGIIAAGTFCGCTNLNKVVLPDNLVKIENTAFSQCDIKSLEIPTTVKEIADRAFETCRNLNQIKLHEGLVTIGERAFYDCNSLLEITIPKSVLSIGKNAFQLLYWLPTFEERKKYSCIRSAWDDLVIGCYAGSYALEYARKEGFKIKNAAVK